MYCLNFADFADEEYKPPLYSPEIKPVPAIPHVVLRPQRVQVKYRNGIVPLEQSVFRNSSKCICDVGVYFGQHFRIGWGKGLTLATQSSICTANAVIDGEVDHLCRIISGRKDADYSPNVVHKLEMSTYSSTDNMKVRVGSEESYFEGDSVTMRGVFDCRKLPKTIWMFVYAKVYSILKTGVQFWRLNWAQMLCTRIATSSREFHV